jgi:hypothetical protein
MHRLLVIVLLLSTRGSALAQAQSARDVVVRFCDLDAQGKQLTPEGWQKVAALFINPGVRKLDRILVVRDFVVSRPIPEEGKLWFRADYTPIGWIDPERALFSPLPPTLEVRGDFSVVSGSDREWRIEGPVPNPGVTVDAAIRYAMVLRANAKDDATRKSADKALAALKRFH